MSTLVMHGRLLQSRYCPLIWGITYSSGREVAYCYVVKTRGTDKVIKLKFEQEEIQKFFAQNPKPGDYLKFVATDVIWDGNIVEYCVKDLEVVNQ